MAYTNFTQQEQQVFDLALDLARNDYSAHIDNEKVTKKDLENYLRKTIQEDILKGKTLYQAFRRNNIVMFEIIEEIVNVTIGDNVLESPFIDSFVEVKNRALGDKSAFYSEGGLLSVATFAGNHWDTNRQAIDLGSEITLPKEWIYIHVYEELERFLIGITPLEKLIDKVYLSINKYIQDRLYAQFQNVANAIPSDFSSNGNSEAAVGGLCDKVAAAGGYASLTIAGTKGALRKLAGIVPDKMFSNSQKEAKAATGSIGEWEGNKLMVIPQTLQSGTFNLALNDSQLFILGGDTKPIKLEVIGDTRSDMDTTGKKNNDMTIDFQVQTLIGMGLVLPTYTGLFTFN
ncbi:MAG: hypothetical protein IJV31_00890 [Clostridia bacterium]|nr:hypothetical protein [Clostridia bacterium]MBQ9657307.1 hypothetical protein [Clostridia bacterium]